MARADMHLRNLKDYVDFFSGTGVITVGTMPETYSRLVEDSAMVEDLRYAYLLADTNYDAYVDPRYQWFLIKGYTPFTIGIEERIRQNPYFNDQGNMYSMDEMEESMQKGELDLAVVFPQNFQESLVHSGEAAVQLLSNSSDPNRGSIAATYTTAIIAGFQREQMGLMRMPFQIQTENRMIYNPLMKSSYMFVPGIMGLVLMIICTIMTSVSIVREKERGTIPNGYKPMYVR